MKTEKSVKYLKFWVALDSLRTVWQVFDTFFYLPGETILRSSNFGDNEWRVGSYLYDKIKKTVFLAGSEAASN